MAEFMKCKRDAKVFSEGLMDWRLASVDEVKKNIGRIRELGIIKSSETVRLLDGYVETYKGYEQYRPNMENMILVKTDRSRLEDGSFDPEMYSEVSLFRKGGSAALLLAREDKITEAICFVLYSMVRKEGDADICQKSPEKRSKKDLCAALKKTLKDRFDNGRELLQCAIDHAQKHKHPVQIAGFLMEIFEDEKESLTGGDVNGRTILHFAALRGHVELCKLLIDKWKMRADETDINKEDVLHSAVKGNNRAVFDYLCGLDQVQSIICSEDAQKRTALQKAAAKGATEMMETLLSKITPTDDRYKYIRHSDIFGQTALLEAARGGHVEAVKFLWNKGSRPLHERNSDGRSALHYAVQLSNDERAKEMAELLLEQRPTDKDRPDQERQYLTDTERSLFLWASATGRGTAEEYLRTKREKQRRPNPGVVENYLRTQMHIPGHTTEDLLSSAIDVGLETMALELVTRGAPTSQFKNRSWRGQAKLRAENLKKHICNLDRIPDIGRDQPALYDTLERKEFAQGLAALFLNPYVKPPLTVGIFGDWGMGKSSLMIQTESILLQTASQLAFPNLLQTEQFPGCGQIELSPNGHEKYKNVSKAVKNSVQSSRSKDDPLLEFLDGEYQEKYYKVYKSLALIDRGEMMDAEDEDGEADSRSYKSALTRIPSILTVRYNAWRYQNESQAWAGLAVEITKEVEESMTTAQRVRCHCRYAWERNRNKIWLELILPCLFAIFLSGWIAWVIWKLVSRSKNSDLVKLTYGSIPITILVAVWTIMNQFFSVIKPISSQVMEYFSRTDHSAKLGYQHEVISDINFLVEEIGEKPSRPWKFIGRLCDLLHLYPESLDAAKIASIANSPAPGKDYIRIIVFVDDLDRCDDRVTLKVLSAIHLVLAACNINVVLGMDQKMIARAMKLQFPDSQENLEELAMKYISKIVQLPLALPDTSDDETKKFLHVQLGPTFEESQFTGSGESQTDQDSTQDNGSTSGQDPDHVCGCLPRLSTEVSKHPGKTLQNF